jgi:UDP-N-acetylglucosamine pyrophosphorylase
MIVIRENRDTKKSIENIKNMWNKRRKSSENKKKLRHLYIMRQIFTYVIRYLYKKIINITWVCEKTHADERGKILRNKKKDLSVYICMSDI